MFPLTVDVDCYSSIVSRRSVRRLGGEVSEEKARMIVEAGLRAPSAHDLQPWQFFVITDQSVRGRLAEELMKEHLARFGDTEAAQRVRESVLSTPLIIVGCVDLSAVDRSSELEMLFATQGLAAAAENMLLAAHCLGLAGYWRGVPAARPDIFRSALGIPENALPQVMLQIGVPLGGPRKKGLRRGTVHWNSW